MTTLAALYTSPVTFRRARSSERLTSLGLGRGKRRTPFFSVSQDPSDDNFLDQMRLVSHAGLAHLFRIDTKRLAPQSLDSGQAVASFMEWQREKWEEDSGAYTIAGCLGGDGDWAKEGLAFGAMIENSYWGIYRVWSRAWLVTK
jgi:hypothetical protein